MPDEDESRLTDYEKLIKIGEQLAELRARRDSIHARMEPRFARRKRTATIVTSTVLTAGSLLTAAITPWSLFATSVGFYFWIKAIESDSAEENRQMLLRNELSILERDLARIDEEYSLLKTRIGRSLGLQ